MKNNEIQRMKEMSMYTLQQQKKEEYLLNLLIQLLPTYSIKLMLGSDTATVCSTIIQSINQYTLRNTRVPQRNHHNYTTSNKCKNFKLCECGIGIA